MNKRKYLWIWIVVGFAALFAVGGACAYFFFRGGEYPLFPHMMGGMMYPAGMFGMVLFWGCVIFLVYRLFRKENDSAVKTNEALEALNRRLAEGQISIEEYETIKKKLGE